MKKFVLLAYGRSGSTLLTDSLKQHPDIRMFGELFFPDAAFRRAHFHVDGRALGADEDGAGFARDVVYAGRAKGAVGFKLLHDQAEAPPAGSVRTFLAETKDVHVVHLYRDNPLASLVSWEIAQRTDEWHVSSRAGVVPKTVDPFPLGRWKCEWFFGDSAEKKRRVTALFADHPMLEVEYERDLCADFSGCLARVTSFLGVAPFSPEKRLVKQGRRPLREQIANFAELKRHFEGTPHERYFD